MPSIGSLFAGIGGFDLAFERHGASAAWQCEIDPTCQRVLAHHWPDTPRIADVRDAGAQNLEPVDIITFGSPCQDLSVAGKRAGLKGERSGLFFEAIRIIRELRPRFALWENVAGALSSHHGRDFAAALDALAECGALDIGWRVLDAQYFGVPQRRRRVFVVADFGGQSAGEILFESTSLSGNLAPGRTSRETVAALTSTGVGTCGADDNQGRAGHLIAGTVSAKWAKGTGGPSGDETQNLLAFDTRQITSKINRARVEPGLPAPTLNQGGDVHIAHALTAAGHAASEDGTGRGTPLVAQSSGVRRLTPLECSRLQGFPDDWLMLDGLSDSAKYRMLGNSVAVPVIEWIARRMMRALTDTETQCI